MIVDKFYETNINIQLKQCTKRLCSEMNLSSIENFDDKYNLENIKSFKNTPNKSIRLTNLLSDENKVNAYEYNIEMSRKRKSFKPNLQFIQEVSKPNELKYNLNEEYEMKEMKDINEINEEYSLKNFQENRNLNLRKENSKIQSLHKVEESFFQSNASNPIISSLKNSPCFIYLLKSNKNRILHENKDHVTSKFSKRLQENNLLLLLGAASTKKRDLKLLIKNQNSNFVIPPIVEFESKIDSSNTYSLNSTFSKNYKSKEETCMNSPNEMKDLNQFQNLENCKVYVKNENKNEKCKEDKTNQKSISDINVLQNLSNKLKIKLSENKVQENLSENLKDSEDLKSESKEEEKKCPLGHTITLQDPNICKKCSKQFEKCKQYASECKGQLLSLSMNKEIEFCCSNGHRWLAIFSKNIFNKWCPSCQRDKKLEKKRKLEEESNKIKLMKAKLQNEALENAKLNFLKEFHLKNAHPTFREIVNEEIILKQAENQAQEFQTSEKNQNICTYEDSFNVYMVLLYSEKDLITQMSNNKAKDFNS